MRYYHMYVRRIVFVLESWANNFRMFGLPILLLLMLLLLLIETRDVVPESIQIVAPCNTRGGG